MWYILQEHDSTNLVQSYKGPATTILIDQGLDDNFLKQNQLLPENLVESSKSNSLVTVNLRSHQVFRIFISLKDA